MAVKKEVKTTAKTKAKKKAVDSNVTQKVAEPVKTELSYSQRLKARAQRGAMTHQKKHAIELAEKKEAKGAYNG